MNRWNEDDGAHFQFLTKIFMVSHSVLHKLEKVEIKFEK